MQESMSLTIPDDDRMNVVDEDHVLDEQVTKKFSYLILSILHVLFKCSKCILIMLSYTNHIYQNVVFN